MCYAVGLLSLFIQSMNKIEDMQNEMSATTKTLFNVFDIDETEEMMGSQIHCNSISHRTLRLHSKLHLIVLKTKRIPWNAKFYPCFVRNA